MKIDDLDGALQLGVRRPVIVQPQRLAVMADEEVLERGRIPRQSVIRGGDIIRACRSSKERETKDGQLATYNSLIITQADSPLTGADVGA